MMSKYSCDVIQDLLPLYQDQICSNKSKEIIEEHLAECTACKKVARLLQDDTIETQMQTEAKHVLEEHQKNERKRSYKAGLIMTGILLVPIIICFICNLAIGGGLNWFFLVLTSMLVAGSVTVVPIFSDKHKASRAVICMTITLVLLLFTAALLTHGHWFLVASSGLVFGLSTICTPLILLDYDFPALRGKVGIISMAWISLWFILLIASAVGIGATANAFVFCLYLIPAWIVFLFARFVPLKKYWKTAFGILITGITLAFSNDFAAFVLYGEKDCFLKYVNLSNWTDYTATNANACLVMIIAAIIIGAIVVLIGAAGNKVKKMSNNNKKHN